MEIPVEVANKLWKDYPSALLDFKLWEQLHCDTGWDDNWNLILTPVSLSHHKAQRRCTVSPLVTPLIMNVVNFVDTETEVGLTEPKTEMDDRYDRMMDDRYDRMMASCFLRAQAIVDRVKSLDNDYLIVEDIAIALFQAKVGQIVTVKTDTGPTGLQG